MSATDGDIGQVDNFMFDDARWAVRYMVVKTGGFFDDRRVLISPISFRLADRVARRFLLSLTVDKVKSSPDIDVDKPVSRQHERDYHNYYGYPMYWGYAGLWGLDGFPGGLATAQWDEAPEVPVSAPANVHLRSAEEVRGYHVQGTDEAIGHIADFIVDDETWAVRYLVIDTSNWWIGKRVLVAPQWTKSISWEHRKVEVELSRESIKNSPEWDPAVTLDHAYEARLYDHYNRPIR